MNFLIIFFRQLYSSDLDPLTILIQQEIDRDAGFSRDHIFYKIIMYGLKSATTTPRNFQWSDDIVDFVNSIESTGGATTCNLLRGPGNLDKGKGNGVDGEPFWSNINIPLPSKRTRQRRKSQPVTSTGLLTENIKNFLTISSASSTFIRTEQLEITPVCLSRDAMAIKPSGDMDNQTNLIVGLTHPVDLDFVKENPYPDPEKL